MTIDRSWLSCFKEDAFAAFSEKMPFRPKAVFSDGQIRLMQSPPSQPQTWDQYIFNRFVRYYEGFLRNSNILIIAFDNYTYVPMAKAMTQANRRKQFAPVEFHDSCPLPCMVPENERWMQYMANRVFKTKVIEMVVLRLPKILLQRHPECTIIVDHDVPIQYKMVDNVVQSETIEQLPALGEADVKFTRWADRYGRLIVDSIDGDSVPIALMHHEHVLAQQMCPPKIAIYRYKIKTEEDAQEKNASSQEEKTTGKRKRDKRTLEFEYLDIHTLYIQLQNSIRQAVGKLQLPMHVGHEIRMLIVLIILTGTDFTRNIPLISGRSVWDKLVNLWVSLAVAYDPSSQQLKISQALNKLITKIYQLKFQKQLTATNTYSDVYKAITQTPQISMRVKKYMPPEPRVITTLKNANWVLQYWKCESTPNPIGEQFGYSQINGKTVYEDEY